MRQRMRSYNAERYFLSAIVRHPRFFPTVDHTVDLFAHDDTLSLWRRVEEACFLRGKNPGQERLSYAELAQTREHKRAGSFDFERDAYERMVTFEMGGNDPAPLYRMLVLYTAQRQLESKVREALDSSLDDDPSAAIEAVQRAAQSVSVFDAHHRQTLTQASNVVWANKDTRRKPRVRTGYAELDALIGPWMPGQSYGFVARAHHGKSLFVGNCAERQVLLGFRVGILSFEDPAELWSARFLSRTSGVPFTTLRDTLLSGERSIEGTDSAAVEMALLDSAMGDRIHVVEADGATAEDAAHMIRELVHYAGVHVVWLDYLQEMRSIRTVTQDLSTQLWHALRVTQSAAKEVGIPLGVMSQANRNCEVEHRFPVLSDSEWCGAFEKKMASGTILVQPAMFSDKACRDAGIASEKNLLVLGVQKARMGCKGVVRLHLDDKTLAITEDHRDSG